MAEIKTRRDSTVAVRNAALAAATQQLSPSVIRWGRAVEKKSDSLSSARLQVAQTVARLRREPSDFIERMVAFLVNLEVSGQVIKSLREGDQRLLAIQAKLLEEDQFLMGSGKKLASSKRIEPVRVGRSGSKDKPHREEVPQVRHRTQEAFEDITKKTR
jgi:hypothetical protein